MFSTKGLHQLDVHGLVAVGSKDAEMGLTPEGDDWLARGKGGGGFKTNGASQSNALVQSLGRLTDAAGEAVVDQCGLEHFRESGVDIHHTSGSDAVQNTTNGGV